MVLVHYFMVWLYHHRSSSVRLLVTVMAVVWEWPTRITPSTSSVQVAAIVAAACFNSTSGFVHPLLNYGLRQIKSQSHSQSNSASASVVLCAKALIIQNKGGSYGELGYQLAKLLKSKDEIDSITILQDSKCNKPNKHLKYVNVLDTRIQGRSVTHAWWKWFVRV